MNNWIWFLYIFSICFGIIFSVLETMIVSRFFAILQQNMYINKKSIYWFYNCKNKYFYNFLIASIFQLLIAGISVFIVSLTKTSNHFYLILLICNCAVIFQHHIIMSKYVDPLKVKLNITYRIKRLLATFGIIICVFNCLICFFIFYNAPMLVYLLPIIYLGLGGIVIFANIINYPIEKIIQLKFIKQAKAKLKSFPNLIVIGITGSYGKTSTKNYLYEILSKKYNVLKTPNSYNTAMGITKTILNELNSGHEIFIVEMGADHNNDIKKLCKIIAPNISIITSVGKQHLETFKTLDNIINTKYQIVQFSKQDSTFFTNVENKLCKVYFDATLNRQKVCIGKSDNCFVKLLKVDYGLISKFKVLIDNEKQAFETSILGEFNIYNIMLAISVAVKLNVSMFDIRQAVKNLQQVDHRLNVKTLPNNAILIDDSFNANPNGTIQSLNVLKQFDKQKIVITCGMVELKEEQYKENFEFGKRIAQVADLTLIINKINYLAIYNGLISENYDTSRILYFSSFKSAYEYIYPKTNSNHILLIENDLTDSYII